MIIRTGPAVIGSTRTFRREQAQSPRPDSESARLQHDCQTGGRADASSGQVYRSALRAVEGSHVGREA